MANVKHGVIRTDLMRGTDVGPALRSLKYMGTGSTATEIDNGNVVKLDSLLVIDATAGTYEREIWKAVTPAKSDALTDIAIVATPETLYDERLHNLSDFYNEAGAPARGYIPHSGDIFSVTPEALNIASGATPAVGWVVELMAGIKLNCVASATSGSTVLGKVIAIEQTSRYTYYVIKVA